MIYLFFYVDDMLVVVKDLIEVKKFKELLSSEFEMKDLCCVKRIFGMNIYRDRKKGMLTLF